MPHCAPRDCPFSRFSVKHLKGKIHHTYYQPKEANRILLLVCHESSDLGEVTISYLNLVLVHNIIGFVCFWSILHSSHSETQSPAQQQIKAKNTLMFI